MMWTKRLARPRVKWQAKTKGKQAERIWVLCNCAATASPLSADEEELRHNGD